MAGGTQKARVCFVAPNNYNVLAARDDLQHIGGAEVQRALIARELARRGHDIRFVTWDHGQPDGVAHDGIRVFKTCPPAAGLPGIRFLHPRWTSLWAAMARADADVYYQRTAGAESGQVALWCRRKGRRFVFAVAQEAECDGRLGGLRNRRERWLYRYALRHADVIVAQTETQRRMLAEYVGRAARVIRSCAPEPEVPAERPSLTERLAARRILWVGRTGYPKRPEMLLELARLTADCHFDVVGIPTDTDAKHRDLIRAFENTANVTLHGFVPHGRVGAYYDGAAAVICTSVWEGFPNTFLEAWSRGVPTISTVDPDAIIQGQGVGALATSPEAMRDAIRDLLASPDRWSECAARARRYFQAHHTVRVAGDAYETLLADLLPPGFLTRSPAGGGGATPAPRNAPA
jgi:glycosyltransferase involved in cell wall biosynthesis